MSSKKIIGGSTLTDDDPMPTGDAGVAGWTHAELVVISSTDHTFSHTTRGFIIGTDGAFKVDTAGGETITFPTGQFAVGVEHPGHITKVYKTGTTAANMVGVW